MTPIIFMLPFLLGSVENCSRRCKRECVNNKSKVPYTLQTLYSQYKPLLKYISILMQAVVSHFHFFDDYRQVVQLRFKVFVLEKQLHNFVSLFESRRELLQQSMMFYFSIFCCKFTILQNQICMLCTFKKSKGFYVCFVAYYSEKIRNNYMQLKMHVDNQTA